MGGKGHNHHQKAVKVVEGPEIKASHAGRTGWVGVGWQCLRKQRVKQTKRGLKC